MSIDIDSRFLECSEEIKKSRGELWTFAFSAMLLLLQFHRHAPGVGVVFDGVGVFAVAAVVVAAGFQLDRFGRLGGVVDGGFSQNAVEQFG